MLERNHPSKARTATQHNVKESEATQRKATAATTVGDGHLTFAIVWWLTIVTFDV